eukprot:NODE_320_length_9849_cov_0.608923.p4 type:complete len:399 gc:universal NODE_320_length_9849_cov_0.608923:3137-1941(-)
MLLSLLHATSVDCPNVIQFAHNLNMHLVNSSAWSQLNINCCLADGIVCLSNKVSQINWGNYSLNGSLSGNLTSLSSLTNLDLSNNLIDGSILLTFPSNIRAIQLNDNHLNGSIENWIIPSKVQNLILSGNNFTGHLPSTLPNQLNRLSAEHNMFIGGLPYFPPSVQIVYLGFNLLSGSITTFPPLLKQFSVNYNMFSGVLPIMPDSASSIYLTQNQFTGTFSAFKPQVLFINNNKFTGLNITDYSAIVTSRCSIDQNPLAGASNLPSPLICLQNNLYSLPNTDYSFSLTENLIDLPLVSSNFANDFPLIKTRNIKQLLTTSSLQTSLSTQYQTTKSRNKQISSPISNQTSHFTMPQMSLIFTIAMIVKLAFDLIFVVYVVAKTVYIRLKPRHSLVVIQ